MPLERDRNSFRSDVYEITSQIPRGRVSTYGAVASALSLGRGSRSVGRALNQNPHAPKVPCHRVVHSDGRLGGYSKGVEEKIRLLELEGVVVKDGRILNFRERIFTEFNRKPLS